MYTLDTETFLIGPGRLAPPPVCLQMAHDGDNPEVHVVGIDEVGAQCAAILQSDDLIVGQNIAFDLLVIARQYPELMPLVFKAYSEGRVADNMIREKLKRIGDGHYWRLKGNGWSLGVLGKRYGVIKDSNDPWRMRYGELWGIPFDSWPEDAQKYALGDIVATRHVYMCQAEKVGSGKTRFKIVEKLYEEYGLSDPEVWRVSPDEERQCRAAWMLHLISDQGVYTDLEQIRRFEQQEREQYDLDKQVLLEADLVRFDGSRNLKAAKERMEQVYKEKGGKPRLTAKGNISLDEDACIESGDELLQAYQRYGSRKNLLTRIQALYRGVHTPINPSFDSLVETGRTSCRKASDNGATNGYQLQNMRRVSGERECFIPRPGNVFLASDYDTLELGTLAQVCLWAVGESELARVLQGGGDPHLALAAEIQEMAYDQAVQLYADINNPERAKLKNTRQTCKVANFGFPGGMASSTFCSYARGYGVELTEAQSASLQERWFERWREMAGYFNWIRTAWEWREGQRKDRLVQVTTIKQFVSERIRANITYTVACNTFFQGLAADLAKAAGYALALECEMGELQGWKAWNFVHDEYILEGPEGDGDRAAKVVSRVMQEEAQKFMPDIPAHASPALMRRWVKKAEPVYRDGILIPWEDRDVVSS